MWTQFWDMHSGGGLKESPYHYIYIEASEKEAIIIFYNRFGHNPHRVTCTCCGNDYSVQENKSLLQLTAFHRHCDFNRDANKYVERGAGRMSLAVYKQQPDVLFIYAEDIKSGEREGTVPEQGYVWMD